MGRRRWWWWWWRGGGARVRKEGEECLGGILTGFQYERNGAFNYYAFCKDMDRPSSPIKFRGVEFSTVPLLLALITRTEGGNRTPLDFSGNRTPLDFGVGQPVEETQTVNLNFKRLAYSDKFLSRSETQESCSEFRSSRRSAVSPRAGPGRGRVLAPLSAPGREPQARRH
eukprot:752874-Hanusia_phi.AAC.4